MMKTIKTLLNMVVSFVLVLNVQASETTFFSFDEGAEDWTIAMADEDNSITLEDNFEDYVEGDGALEVTVALTDLVSWGTWTDISYTFAEAVDMSGYSEMRFNIKILKEPTGNCKTMQFTCDLTETSTEMWRYPEDHDIFYSPSASDTSSEWFEVVIPFSRLVIPFWASPIDGEVDLSSVTGFKFGVHADSSWGLGCNPADTVQFLIDNLHLTNPVDDGAVVDFEEGADEWVIAAAHDQTSITLEDDYENFIEGDGSLKVTCVVDTPFYTWGTWTDISTTIGEDSIGLDVGDATEFRFFLKIDSTNMANRKNLIFTCDFVDSDGQLFRWGSDNERPGHYGFFNHIDIGYNEWEEYVIPFADFFTPGWADSPDYDDVLDSPTSWKFGIHARQESEEIDGDTVSMAVADTVVFWLDDVHFTHPSYDALSVDDERSLFAHEFTLSNAYPNPFNPTTTIDFTLHQNEEINLSIYNINGQLVKSLKTGIHHVGNHSVVWNGRNTLGEPVGSGVYIYSLSTQSNTLSKRLVLLK